MPRPTISKPPCSGVRSLLLFLCAFPTSPSISSYVNWKLHCTDLGPPRVGCLNRVYTKAQIPPPPALSSTILRASRERTSKAPLSPGRENIEQVATRSKPSSETPVASQVSDEASPK